MNQDNLTNTEYKCLICNKHYKNHSGLWKHNQKHHKIINNQIPIHNEQQLVNTSSVIKISPVMLCQPTKQTAEQVKNCLICKKCKIVFNSNSTRWRHEKLCQADTTNDKIVKLESEIDKLKTQLTKISDNPKVINNYTQNNNNVVIAKPPGLETIDHLTIEQKRFIMNKGLSSLMYLIETTNFDKSTPENHSYCVTAINDKHASMVDTKTNSIIKTDKMELYDKVLAGNLNKLEKLSGDGEFNQKEKLAYIGTVDRLKNTLFLSKKGIKKYYSEINLLSYNNKELVQETWNGLKKLDELVITNKIPTTNNQNKLIESQLIEPESDIESDEEINTEKLNKLRKQFGVNKLIPDSYNSDSELSSDEESDSETCGYPEINVNGKQYILDGNQVFAKNQAGTKGDFYGTYVNGKIKKVKQTKELDI